MSEMPKDKATATREALMDATERLLVAAGQAGVSTRRIADEAGQPHGLVRYHFGSIGGLMLATVERAADRILERQRELYAGDRPFLEKWRTAMGYVDVDLEAGFPKLTAELFARAWNDPALRPGLRRVMEGFTEMLAEAVRVAARDYDVEIDDAEVLALATLIRSFQLGLLVERLTEIDVGHAELLEQIDRRLAKAERRSPDAREEP